MNKWQSKTFSVILFVVFCIIVVFITILINKENIFKNNKQQPLQKVTLNLSWVHQAEFSGNYVAREKGFYRKNGLDVDIIPFDFKSSVAESVTSGDFNFGVMGADQLLVAREKGFPLKAIAVIYKTNPAVVFSLKSNNILQPKDLIGKTIGIEKGSNTEYLYSAMMNKLNIDRKQIKEVEIGYEAKELLLGEIDASTGYIINEPNLVKEAGQDTNIILMSDYGVNIYGDVIFTTENLIKNNPDLVRRFLDATLEGWQYSIENQEEATDIVLKYAVNNTREHQFSMLKDSIPLISDGVSFLGWMDKEQWQLVQDILLGQDIISKPIYINDVFTVEFLANYYMNKKR